MARVDRYDRGAQLNQCRDRAAQRGRGHGIRAPDVHEPSCRKSVGISPLRVGDKLVQTVQLTDGTLSDADANAHIRESLFRPRWNTPAGPAPSSLSRAHKPRIALPSLWSRPALPGCRSVPFT